MDDYVIAICSYKREKLLQEKTLKELQERAFNPKQIFIFVANEDERLRYSLAIPREAYREIVIARPGLSAARNFVLDYFPLSKPIVFMDDDISEFKFLKGDRLTGGNLHEAIETAFEETCKAKATLWGVSPVPNAFFMRPTITTHLKFCVGPCFGMINPGATSERGICLPELNSEKEDYIRTLMCWERDKAIVRLNWLAVKTAYYKTEGGMMAEDRLEKQKIAIDYIKTRWPGLVRDNLKRKSGFPEILIRSFRPKKT